jgi:murein DD-endopeptidase MepM/ murein hydrolase activator NlpD
MSAIAGHKWREHLAWSTLHYAAGLTFWLAAAGCVQDDAAPVAKAAVAAPVPIVDMSPSAQRPLLPAVTPVVAGEPAAQPEPRPVPAREASVASAGDIAMLRGRGLLVPVAGVRSASLVGSFNEVRGSRVHEALDIAAPRGTPVLSTDDGTVLKLFTSRGGGLTIYAADPTKKFIYYYAHLDAYAPALAEGQAIAKGQLIGTVGTTGNAPPNTPHLHFAILRNDDMSKWWMGTPLDPFLVLRAGVGR